MNLGPVGAIIVFTPNSNLSRLHIGMFLSENLLTPHPKIDTILRLVPKVSTVLRTARGQMVKALDPRSKCLGFDSSSADLV